MRRCAALVGIFCVTVAGVPMSALQAATLYWDASNAANNNVLNGSGLGAAGTWDTSSARWWPGSGTVDQAWSNAALDTAVFWGTAGTVTVGTPVTVGGLTFNTTNYVLSTGANTLSFGATNNLIALNNVAAATITGSVGGTGNVTLSGGPFFGLASGTLTLNGTSSGGWSGATTINNGMTMLLSESNQALQNTSGITLNGGTITLSNTAQLNRVSDTASIISNGGTFNYTNTATASTAYTETIGSVALTSGQLNFVLTNDQTALSNTQTLTLSGLTRTGATNRSSISFSAGGAGLNTSTNQIVISGAGTSAFVGPWATVGTTAALQTDYAAYSANNVVAANIGASASTTWTNSANSYTSNNNGNSATFTLNAAAHNLSGLRNITNQAATTTIPSSGNLNTFGLLNAVTTLWTIASTGSGAVSTPSGGGNLYINAGSGPITITAPINNNGAGVTTIVKTGASTLTLNSTTSTFSGGLFINSGVANLGANTGYSVVVDADTSLGAQTGGITFNSSGTINFSASFTLGASRTITINNGAIARFAMLNFSGGIAGKITGSGGLLIDANSGTRTITLSNTTNDFEGPLTIGFTSNNLTGAIASLADSTTATGEIRLGGTSGVGIFQWSTGAAGPLTLNNRQIDLRGTSSGGGGVIENAHPDANNSIRVNTNLLVTGASTKTLTLQGTNTGANVFAGRIGDGAGALSLTKAGTGYWALAGIDIFTGTVTIQGGTLALLSSTGSLAVVPLTFNFTAPSGTFLYDGTGASGTKSQALGALTLTSGEAIVQSIRGGASSATLTFASLARSAGATVNFVNDGVNGVNNSFTITGQAVGFINQGVFFNGSNYAWMNAAGTYVRGINYTTDNLAFTTGATTSITPGSNLYFQTTGAVSAQASATFTTLNIAGANNFTLAAAQTLTVNGILKSGGSSATISGGAGLQPAAATELVIRTDLAADFLTISTPVVATTSLTKSGAGTLRLNGASDYATMTNVTAVGGTLQLTVDSAASTASAFSLTNGANLLIDGSQQLTLSGIIGGAGTLTKSSDNTLVLSGPSTFTGSTIINGGVVSVAAAANLGASANPILVDNNATFQVTGAFGTITAATHPVTVGSGGATFDFQADQSMQGLGLSGTGPITKIGAGIWTVSTNISTFSGALNVNVGKLLYTGNVTPNAAGLTVADGATFNINDDTTDPWSLASGMKFTFAGNGVGGVGALQQTGQSGATNAFISTLVNEVVLAADTRISTEVTLATIALGTTVSGPGGIEKIGAGNLLLSVGNTFAGGVNLAEGTLLIDSQGSGASNSSLGTGTLTLSAGTLSNAFSLALDFSGTTNNALVINGDFTFAGVGTLNLGTGAANLGTTAGTTRTITVSGAALTLGNNIANGTTAVGITKAGAGTLVLTGVGTYTGPTIVTSGTLQIGDGGATGSFGASSGVQVDALLVLNRSGSLTVTQDISGTGGVVSRGTGISAFAGTNSYLGTTTVERGTLRLDYTTNNTSKLPDSSVLFLGGGTLDLFGGSHTEIVGSTSLIGSAVVSRSSGGATLRMNAITPGAGSVHFTGSGIADTDTLNTNGILGGWATITVGGVTGWAVNSTNAADGPIVSLSTYTDVTRLGPSSIPHNPAVPHVRIVDGGTSGDITPAGGALTQIESLFMASAAGPAEIDFGLDTNVLNIGTTSGGGILLAADAAALTIGSALNDGVLTSGGVANAAPAFLYFNVQSATNDLTINSLIADNGTDVVSVFKTGAGRLVLNATNTFTGSTTLTAGILRTTGGAGALGTGAAVLNLAGGTLQLVNSTGTNYARNTTVTGNVEITNDRGAAGVGVTHSLGTLSIGAQTLTVSGAGADSGTQGLTFGAVTSTGATTFTVNNNGAVTTLLTLASIVNSSGNPITFNGTGNITVTGAIGNSAAGINKSGSGMLTLTGTNTFVGQVTLAGGVLSVNNSLALGAAANDIAIDNNAVLRLTAGTIGTVTNTATDRQITVGSGGATFDFQVDQAFSGGLSGTGTVTKTGAGSWTVGSAENPFSGNIIVAGGELKMFSVQLGNTARITVQSGAALTIEDNGTDTWLLIPGGRYELSGAGISNNGALRQNLQSGGLLPYTSTIVNEVVLNSTLTRVNTSAILGTIALTSVVSGTGGLEKVGVGTLTLSGVNTYAAGTTISAGILRASNSASALGSGILTLAGGTLQLWNDVGLNFGRNTIVSANSQIQVDRIGNPLAGVTHSLGTLSIGAQTLTVSGGSQYYGTQGLTFGAVTSTGATIFTVNNGTTGKTLLTLGSITNGSGTIAFNGTGNAVVAGPIGSSTGGLTKSGGGTLTLQGAGSYSGPTTVDGGTFIVDSAGSVASTITVNSGGTLAGSGQVASVVLNSGGNISPGTAGVGKLTSSGATHTWNDGSTVYFEFRDPTGGNAMAGTNWDLVDLTGSTLSLSGVITLRVDAWKSDNSAHATSTTDNGFDQNVSYQWLFATTGGLSGFTPSTFVVVDNTAGAGVFGAPSNAFTRTLQAGAFWVSNSGNDLYLNYSAIPEPGSLTLVALAGIGYAGYRRYRRQVTVDDALNVTQ